MKTVLILGATGTVGRALVTALAERNNVSVRAATRIPERYNHGSKVSAVEFDLGKPQTFARALDGVDAVFQVCPAGHFDSHGLLAPFIAEAAKTVDKFVTLSAQGVDAAGDIPLRRLELAVEATGKSWVHLRPTWFAQNFDMFWLEPIRQSGVIALPAGNSRTAFIDARDIAAVAAEVLISDRLDNRALELTGPTALTYAQAGAILGEVTGRPIRYQPIADEAFVANMTAAGMPADYAEFLAALFAAVRAGSAANVTNIVESITHRPPRSLREYAQDYRDAFSQQGPIEFNQGEDRAYQRV